MKTVVSPEHYLLAEAIKKLWSTYEGNRDLISIGAYKAGSDALIDEAIAKRESIARFLIQSQDEVAAFSETLELAGRAIE